MHCLQYELKNNIIFEYPNPKHLAHPDRKLYCFLGYEWYHADLFPSTEIKQQYITA
jgi:hypothetical protein